MVQLNNKEIIQFHSKSFSFSSLFFNKKNQEAVYKLYAWLRYCDDKIDNVPLAVAQANLSELKKDWESAAKNDSSSNKLFADIIQLAAEHDIPQHYFLEFFAGLEMDSQRFIIKNEIDLLLYCYRVAGVVGLMMAHIMRISDSKALRSACDLGIAMQLTNIIRDLAIDFDNNRIYIPENILNRNSFSDIFLSGEKERLIPIYHKVREIADQHYQVAENGIQFLDFTSAIAIQSALYIYAEILNVIDKKGAHAWDKKCYVSFHQKCFLALKAVCKITFLRIKNGTRFSESKISTIWTAKKHGIIFR